jgi:hypothetical protein
MDSQRDCRVYYFCGKGLIRAASSDNIQALALITCKAFGATLALCPETCMKVERIAGMHYESAAVKFLKAQIGYSSGDSAAQLSLDASGVRFLGLAAALGTLGAYQGARALESMLASSAQEKQPLPTVTQLKDLLSALDYKLNRAGFAESLAGWEFGSRTIPCSQRRRKALGLQIAASPEQVDQLVKAFRELARLGDATQVTLTVGVAAPGHCIYQMVPRNASFDDVERWNVSVGPTGLQNYVGSDPCTRILRQNGYQSLDRWRRRRK